jgi:hypothetical protein
MSVFLLALAFGLTMFRLSRRSPAGASAVPRRSWWKSAFAGLSVIVFVFAYWSLYRRAATTTRLLDAIGSPVRPNGATRQVAIDWWLVGPLVLVGLAAIAILFASAARQRASTPRSEPDPGVVRDAAAESLEKVLSEPDHRRAVILAYQHMEYVLGAAGAPRLEWETPFEYLDRVFTEVRAPLGIAARLTELYEHAKFSHHDVGSEMRASAIAMLRELTHEMEDAA